MRVTLSGPAGDLEGLLWEPQEGAPVAAAVVCPPAPARRGDDGQQRRVPHGARSCSHAGLAVLRFNFRGVGASAGEHDGQGGEEGDASAALDWLAERHPGLPLWGAGFSFGARTIASIATRDERLARLLLVALPCAAFDCSMIRDVRPPTHLVMAEHDEFGTLAHLRATFPDLPAHVDAEEVPGVGHFFRGRTPDLERRVREWARGVLAS